MQTKKTSNKQKIINFRLNAKSLNDFSKITKQNAHIYAFIVN